MIFEDRIQRNPRLFRLKDPRTNEIVDFEIQDLLPEEIEQEGTEVDAAYLNSLVTYSENERIIGYWIDGKPIYRKVINFGALPNATTKLVAHNISNIDFVTNYIATAKDTTHNYYLYIPATSPVSNIYSVSCYIDNSNINIQAGDNKTAYTICYVTIEYTKTTD